MRVLFYLPVVTPWWFDAIVAPLIRAAARDAHVSVMVPPLWRNTGIGPEQLAGCGDLDQVDWHILDGDDHPARRRRPPGRPLQGHADRLRQARDPRGRRRRVRPVAGPDDGRVRPERHPQRQRGREIRLGDAGGRFGDLARKGILRRIDLWSVTC